MILYVIHSPPSAHWASVNAVWVTLTVLEVVGTENRVTSNLPLLFEISSLVTDWQPIYCFSFPGIAACELVQVTVKKNLWKLFFHHLISTTCVLIQPNIILFRLANKTKKYLKSKTNWRDGRCPKAIKTLPSSTHCQQCAHRRDFILQKYC